MFSPLIARRPTSPIERFISVTPARATIKKPHLRRPQKPVLAGDVATASKTLTFGRNSRPTIKCSHLRCREPAQRYQLLSPLPAWPGGTITNSHHSSRRNLASERLCSQPSEKLTIALSRRISSSHLVLSNSLTLPRSKSLFCQAKSNHLSVLITFQPSLSLTWCYQTLSPHVPGTIRKSHRDH